MFSTPIAILMLALGGTLLVFVVYTLAVCVRYVPVINRIFEEQPLLQPPRLKRVEGATDIWFRTSDDLELVGSWIRTSAAPAKGIVLFCHEYLSNRWSVMNYCSNLVDEGFDLFAFDFRNSGESEMDSGYSESQWVSQYEIRDLMAAIECVAQNNPGQLPIHLFGVSKGAGTAIFAAAMDRRVSSVVTDGAFPTHSTQLAYMRRWVGIYSRNPLLARIPDWYYSFVAWVARREYSARHGCYFPMMEHAVAKISPRPLLMIHGERDNYIAPEIARSLFAKARDPKELWIVPDAKHNRSVEVQEQEYRERLVAFFSPKSLTPCELTT